MTVRAQSAAAVPVTIVLRQLRDELPPDYFTLDWVMGSLRKRSFGIVMLLLGLAAIAPGVSVAAGLLLMIPACQLILGHAVPVFPRRIATRPIPTRRIKALLRHAIPVLGYLEKAIHPRWQMPPEPTGRAVGVIVLILSAALVFIPIPMSNIAPALVIVLISLAWLEEDGLQLVVAMLAGVFISALAAAAVWEMVRGAEWLARLW
jgi:hypothetical protein